MKPSIQYWEQSINNVLSLKQYIESIPPVHGALRSTSCKLLVEIFEVPFRYNIVYASLTFRKRCTANAIAVVHDLIGDTINPDVSYSTQPLEMRNQRTYAVKAGQGYMIQL